MEELNIIIEPELEFTLKKCGDVVPYGITPEEREKLSEYPELTGDPNKFVSDDGTVKEITSSIGVIGTDFYASVEPSTLLVGAYQLKQAIDPAETEMTIIAGGGAIVSGAKFIDENPAQSFPMGTIGFDYWRKISSLAGEARKGLRFFLFDTSDNSEIDIFAPLWSSPIEVTEFAERQISYSVPAVNPTATQHFGVEFLFTASAANITLTYIVGDGRGWFMRLPLPLKHENLTDKNSEAAFQHIDTTTTKPTLDEADKVPIYDSATGNMVLTPKSNFQPKLVSGTNIKTVNGASILGDGDIVIAGGGGETMEVSYNHTTNVEIAVSAVDVDTDTFTATAHGLINGDTVVPTSNNFNSDVNSADYMLPLKVFVGGITPKRYFVVNKTDNTFQISDTNGGAAINLTVNATMDLAKWHFEKNVPGSLSFTALPESLRYDVRFIIKMGHGGASIQPFAGSFAWAARHWGTNTFESVASCGSINSSNTSGYLFGNIEFSAVQQATYRVSASGRTTNNATTNTYQSFNFDGYHTNFNDDSINNKNITRIDVYINGGCLNGTKIIIYRK